MNNGLEVIIGPMYAGKTEELLRRLRREQIAGREVIIFRPSIDDRFSTEELVSHSGARMSSVYIENAFDVPRNLTGRRVDVIGIDEVQFFDEWILDDIISISKYAKIIVTGLDTDFRHKPFGNIVSYLTMVADKVDKLTAVCQVCGEDATRTQRLVDGKPAPLSGETIIVGAAEQYEARCRNCYE
jgi:thymidine kinase